MFAGSTGTFVASAFLTWSPDSLCKSVQKDAFLNLVISWSWQVAPKVFCELSAPMITVEPPMLNGICGVNHAACRCTWQIIEGNVSNSAAK